MYANSDDPTDPIRLYLNAYISESIEDGDMKFWYNIDSSLKIVLSKFEMIVDR